MSDNKIRWGMLSTAAIGRNHVVPAIQASRNGVMLALASRDLARAQGVARDLEVPRAYGSYAELLADEEIDAVYIPLPSSMHHEWVLKAAATGKHVLCDKPFAASARQAEQMVAACRKAGLKIMEGFMFRHDPRHRRLGELVAGGAIGELRRVRAEFSFPIPRDASNVRLSAELDGGAVGDVGCYCVSVSRLHFGAEPNWVQATLHEDAEFKVDMDGAALLDFGPDSTALIDFSFVTARRQHLQLVGDEGTISLSDCFVPRNYPTVIRIDRPERTVEERMEPLNTYQAEVENLADAIRGEAEEVVPGEDAIGNLRVMDALRASARDGARAAVG